MRRILLALPPVVLAACVVAPRTVTNATPPTAPPVVISSPAPILVPAGMEWGAGPAALPPGARAVVLSGNPMEAGVFTMRLLFPHDYRIPPHSHPAVEHITVISGVFHVGMGDTYAPGNWEELRAGAFRRIQPGMNHFAHAAGETVIQLHGMGPWQVNYVNPADDPRRR